MCLFLFHVFTGLIHSLSTLAHSRLSLAFADSTNRSYTAMFRLYLAFLAFNALDPSQVIIDTILAFFECLRLNNVSYSQMLNYLSSLKAFAGRFSLDVSVFQHSKLALYFKAVQKSSPKLIRLDNIIDKNFLHHIIQKCDGTMLGNVFKAAYLLAFFGFLRLSNVVPHSICSFSHLKHLAKGDIFFSQSYVTILIKWSKTMQLGNQAKLLKLPRLNNHICPFQLFKNAYRWFLVAGMTLYFNFSFMGNGFP